MDWCRAINRNLIGLVVVMTGFLPVLAGATSEKEEFFKKQALSALDGTLPLEYQKPSTRKPEPAEVLEQEPTITEASSVDEVEVVRPEVAEAEQGESQYYPQEGGGEVTSATNIYGELTDPASTLGVGVISGITSYPGVDNTEKAIPLAGLGVRYNMGWGVTMTAEFMYAYHELEVNRLTRIDTETVDDYMFGFDVGYDWINAFFSGIKSYSLITGAVVNHRRRQYNLDENASRSIDGGFFVEGGYRINNRLLLSLKWRYMENLSSDRDELSLSQDLNVQAAANDGTPGKLEEFNSHFALLSLTYLFDLK